jgi:putative hydrolase of the HAD superfamily
MISDKQNSSNTITVILLDLDDTLIDHKSAELKASILFGRQYATSIPEYNPETFNERWHEAAKPFMEAFLEGRITFQEQRRMRLQSVLGRENMNADEADAIFSDYLKHYEASWRIFPDVQTFLDAFSNYRLAVISNAEQAQQEAKLERTGIRDFFELVLTAESAGMAKPDPRIFHHACRLLEVEPGQACCIGNNLENDVIGANEAGLRGIWLNRSGKPAPEGIEAVASLENFRL